MKTVCLQQPTTTIIGDRKVNKIFTEIMAVCKERTSMYTSVHAFRSRSHGTHDKRYVFSCCGFFDGSKILVAEWSTIGHPYLKCEQIVFTTC